jgi:hypothetical protein
MAFLIGNREARESMGMAAARRAKENFDVSTMVQAYERLYESLLHPSQRLNRVSVRPESAMPAEESVGNQTQSIHTVASKEI